MNRDLISKAIVLLVSYREYTGDFRMANLCGEIIEELKAELAKPEQEPDLPPVFIGVDVTLEGTHVTAFYRRPNAVAEMFYSEFHPLAKPDQNHGFDRTGSHMAGEYVDTKQQNVDTSGQCVHKSDKSVHEPVAYVTGYYNGRCVVAPLDPALLIPSGTAFYNAPPRKEWVGLTDVERHRLWEITPPEYEDTFAFAHAIENKLKEKNSA
jgi:hypothetical protein